ncbi:MAG TPA: M4 family metallopeptidase, partial [Roseiflexaceae bacterium]
MSRLRLVLCALAFLAISVAALPAAGFAARVDATTSRDVSIALLRQGADSLAIYRDEQTGVPNFVAGELPTLKADVRDPIAAAHAFFAENASLFRMTNPGAELSVVRNDHDAIGMDHVRFQQRYNGVEVFGAQIIAHMRGKQVTAISGTYFPGLAVNTKPDLTFEQAVARARAEVGVPDAEVAQAGSGLAIYAKDQHNALTWKIELSSMTAPGRWLVFVNAHHGRITHRINMLETALDRKTYNANHAASSSGLPGTLDCSDSPADPTCSDPVIQAAHDNAKKVYDYYFNTFGRDSIDGAGLTLVSSAHFSNNYNNAFWDGQQMVYGDGDGVFFSPLTQGLDVIAHELTHGVTQYTAGLVYEDQPGALNESMSDVMGMFTEAAATGTIDSQLGEDVYTPSIPNDALRDMADPHKGSDFFTLAYNCAYRPTQPGYCGQPATLSEYAQLPVSLTQIIPSDNGGVHTNSGIPNKAAWLLSQGGSAGGITVTGIGRIKAQQIYYRLLTVYLTPYSNFIAARNGAIQACTDLIGQFGITANDCAQVRAAFAAVGVGLNVAQPRQVFISTVSNNFSGGLPAIVGSVTLNGAPVAGVSLQLFRCDIQNNPNCSVFSTTTTDAAGGYRFTGAPAADLDNSGTWYRVVYDHPTAVTDNRIFFWVSDDILNYDPNVGRLMDTFDIADVVLGAPNSGGAQNFPVTFSWTPRP